MKAENCNYCKKPIPKKVRLKNHCSKMCSEKDLYIWRTCPGCNEAFKQRRSEVKKIYCKQACQTKHLTAIKKCTYCGDPVIRTASQFKGDHTFCSMSHRAKYYSDVKRV